MGTRNLTIVRDENILFGQDGQWDGYPDGNGVDVLAFVKKFDESKFREAVKQIVFPDSKTIEDRFDADEVSEKTHPQFYRNFGTDILPFIANSEKPIECVNQIDFAADSLFCEWAYMVDLVERKLRCFKGFNKTPLNETDFFNFLSDKSRGGYYPIREIASFSFDDLPEPDVFVKTLCPPDEE